MQKQEIETETLMETFQYSIKSKATQKQYQTTIGYFEEWHQNKIEELLKLDAKAIEKILIKYIIHMLRDKKLAYASITNRLASIDSFLSLNDVTVNKRKLNRFMGEHNKTVNTEGYTHEDLTKMFQHASFRTKLLISIYSSTGIRKGAIIDLKRKHLKKVQINGIKLYKFRVYEKSINDEYITFCTPECTSLIDEYLAKRKAAGEIIDDESYLIRNEFDFVDRNRSENRIVKKTSIETLNIVMTKVLFECGLRKVHRNHPTESSDDNGNGNTYQRHKKALFHAFRVYFNTCLVKADVNLAIKEKLMGHSIGLDNSYLRTTEEDLLSEYSKAINELTINDENRLRTELEIQKEKNDTIDMLMSQIQSLQKQFNDIKK